MTFVRSQSFETGKNGFVLLNIQSTQSGSASQAETTPEQMLLGCHVRIRHFSQMATKLADAAGAPSDEIARAAAEIYRYFTVALPLHEQDENITLHPRLRRAVGLPAEDGEQAETRLLRELGGPAVDAMVEQHEAIDQVAERLLPLWKILSIDPARHEEVAQEMRPLAAALAQLFDAHLKLEEETVFPAMQRFIGEEEKAEMLAEMKGRRR